MYTFLLYKAFQPYILKHWPRGRCFLWAASENIDLDTVSQQLTVRFYKKQRDANPDLSQSVSCAIRKYMK